MFGGHNRYLDQMNLCGKFGVAESKSGLDLTLCSRKNTDYTFQKVCKGYKMAEGCEGFLKVQLNLETAGVAIQIFKFNLKMSMFRAKSF